MEKIITVLVAILSCACALAGTDKKSVEIENALIETVKNISLYGNSEKTMESLHKLAEKDSTNDAVLYYLGRYEFSRGNARAAEKALTRACELDPDNDDYQEELAKVYGTVGRSRDAYDIYMKLLERKPAKYRNAYTLTLLGDQQMYARKDSMALENYEAALMFDETYAPAILGKAEVYRIRGNLPAFFSTLRDFTTDPTIIPYPKCQYVSSILDHVDGRTFQVWGAQLDTMVTDCVRTHPKDSSALKLAGKWFYRIGERDRSRKYFDELLGYYPESMEAHFIRLQFLSYDEDKEGMIDECKTILNLAKGNREYTVSALSTIGDCYYELGDRENAYSYYEKVLKQDPDYLPVLNNYSYYLSLSGKKLSKARKMSQKTVEAEPDNPTYLDTYGWILHLMGKDKEAKPYFKHAMLYGGKESREVLRHYSEVLDALGEKDLADFYKDLSEKK